MRQSIVATTLTDSRKIGLANSTKLTLSNCGSNHSTSGGHGIQCSVASIYPLHVGLSVP